MTITPVPDGVDAITPEWLTAVLAVAVDLGDARIVAVTVNAVGTGQMCDSFRVGLTFDIEPPAGVPSSVIAKLPSSDARSRATGLSTRAYEFEVLFYQRLAPESSIRTPEAYHLGLDTETGCFVLLLEDLAPARQGDQLAGCTVAQAELAVQELVGLHAPWWGRREIFEAGWLRRHGQGMGAVFGPMWARFQARYEDRLNGDVRAAGDAFADVAGPYEIPPRWEHSTVVHGDYRLDNMLFGGSAGGAPIAVVDWQGVSIGRGPSDVAYFLGAGLVEEDRRGHEIRLLGEYYSSLIANGVQGYEWDACWRDYRIGAFSGLVTTVAASTLVKRTERGDDMFMAMARRHALQILDLDAAGAVRTLKLS